MAEQTVNRVGISEPIQWFVLAGGATAWTLHLMLIYVISEWGCVKWPPGFQWLGITVISWLLIAVSVPSFVLAVVATWVGYRSERALKGVKSESDPRSEEDQAARFNSHLGYLMNGLFAFVIIFETIPTFYFLQSCGG